jgi:hypothetical protein
MRKIFLFSRQAHSVHTRLRLATNQRTPILQETQEIIKVIETFFEAGKTKNFAPLREIQLDDPNFSSFSDVRHMTLKIMTQLWHLKN